LVGPECGNVLLRKAQYTAHADQDRTVAIARPIVAGKIKNARQTVLRAARDAISAQRTGEAAVLSSHAELMAGYLQALPQMETLDGIRGIEGQAAACYFGVFGLMITREKEAFAFKNRTRRPPRDRVNALLSFVYSLLTADCVAALSGVGLDPQFGYLHCIRPGRPALALDLMEEFRSCMADRLILSLINLRQIGPEDFELRPGGEEESVMLTEHGRKTVLTAYQNRKKEEVSHPLLKQKTPFGLVPHLQARLLSRHLRGDLPAYIPYVAR
jgi:CRISPR-associated protein Cas1